MCPSDLGGSDLGSLILGSLNLGSLNPGGLNLSLLDFWAISDSAGVLAFPIAEGFSFEAPLPI